MAKLTAKARQKLKSSQFALPGKGEGKSGKGAGSYPIPDREHGRIAKAYVSQHGTSAEKKKVRAAVKRKFGFHTGGMAPKSRSGDQGPAKIGSMKNHGGFAALKIGK